MSTARTGPHLFGVRHLSPGGAYHLRRFLDEIKPTAVLVEGLSDAGEQIKYFTAKGTRLPIAIMAYTEEMPIRTILYPFAEYSPEYQAILWALEKGAYAAFIDLPSDVFLQIEQAGHSLKAEDNIRPEDGSVYQKWAEAAGEADHETYWERNFEHNLNQDAYRLSIYEFGKGLRKLVRDDRLEYARNLVREAYMRNRIQNAIRQGHSPDKVVVVTGAYHAPALSLDLEPMTDEAFDALPRTKTKLTLMPYSYFKLSSKSGYGAGNNAPAYYSLMWRCICRNDLRRLPSEYLSGIAAYLRERGTPRSAADVIEGVRLANALSALHGGSAPTLKDLRDAAITSLGHGELSVIAEAVAFMEIGTAIGAVPEGVSRTSIQDDFYRELKRLKLEKYKSAVAERLELDLRENRRVKSAEAAYLDLNRSFFLHRLKVLNISFQKQLPVAQQSATWAEAWVLQWTPEAEIELVESGLRGETLDIAAAYAFKERLEQCKNVGEASRTIREACECGLMEAMALARNTLQGLATDSGAFNDIAEAAHELAIVISYGDIRKFDTADLVPILQQLFLRGSLLLLDASGCDNNGVAAMQDSIHRMNQVALEHFQEVDEAAWIRALTALSDRDDRNPRLSGYACAILLERNLMDEEKLAAEVSRRLSPGIEADIGAGWFEGLSGRNRYALLARIGLWRQLSGYVASLDSQQFKRTLVFLRRAFSDFSPSEKRSICESLGEVWGTAKADISDMLSRELDAEEQKRIADLNDFDFGDI